MKKSILFVLFSFMFICSFSCSPNSGGRINSNNITEFKKDSEKLKKINSSLEKIGGNLISISFSSDETKILATYDGCVPKVLNVDTGQVLFTLEDEDKEWIYYGEFSSDNKKIMTVSESKVVKIWDVDSKKCVSRMKFDSHLTNISFSPNNEEVIAFINQTVEIWDINFNEMTDSFEIDFIDSSYLERKLKIINVLKDKKWSILNFDLIHDLKKNFSSESIESDEIAESDEIIESNEIAESDEVAESAKINENEYLSLSKDGSRYLTYQDKMIEICSTATNQVIKTIHYPELLQSVSFLNDDQKIIIVDFDVYARVLQID